MAEQPLDLKRDNLRLALDEAMLSPPGIDASVGARAATDSARPPSAAIAGAPAGYGSHTADYLPMAAGEEVSLLGYVRVLHKRRWTALTAFLIVFSTVTVYTFTTTPIYTARAQVLID